MAAEPRHLSLGVAGGGLTSLLINLLKDWNHHVPHTASFVEPLISDCHCEFWADWDLTEKELAILCIGILIGLVLLPILEFLLVLRQAWSIWVRNKLLGSGHRQLFRAV